MPPENIFERSRKNDKSDEICPIHDGMLPEIYYMLDQEILTVYSSEETKGMFLKGCCYSN